MEQFMKANGKITKDAEKANRFGQIVHYILDFGEMIRPMVKEG